MKFSQNLSEKPMPAFAAALHPVLNQLLLPMFLNCQEIASIKARVLYAFLVPAQRSFNETMAL